MSGSNPNDALSEENKTAFISNNFDICPGNVEIFEKYFPDVEWTLMFRTMPHLIGETMSMEHLNTFISNTDELNQYKILVAEWYKKEKEAEDHLDSIRDGAIDQASNIEKMFEEMRLVAESINQKEEELDMKDIESDDETDWHPSQMPEVAEYYLKSRIVAKNVTEAEQTKALYEAAKAVLEKIQDERPPLPAFMAVAFDKDWEKAVLEEEEVDQYERQKYAEWRAFAERELGPLPDMVGHDDKDDEEEKETKSSNKNKNKKAKKNKKKK